MRIEQNIYKTKNLNFASYLVASGKVQLIRLDKSSSREICFLFSPKDICEHLEKQYWQDKALINPKALLYALNGLKDQMFNQTI
jgi:hypothetical protein